MKTAIIIPARLESCRLPRKLLLSETGRPLLQHTWERACAAGMAERVLIATDSSEVADACRRFGADVVMTDPRHVSGSSRVAEAAETLPPDFDCVVNVQGDEPLIGPADLDVLCGWMNSCTEYEVGTLAAPLDHEHRNDRHVVKVVAEPLLPTFDVMRALYFSRVYLPGSYHHIGVYAFRRRWLRKLPDLRRSSLHELESLEQISWLAAGWSVLAVPVRAATISIDTAGDYERFVGHYFRAHHVSDR